MFLLHEQFARNFLAAISAFHFLHPEKPIAFIVFSSKCIWNV
ncbi:MAG TPA: hypothetical protein DEB17_00790 [Chlorobaculum sp.]|uniref:Uncharacterized protein n=1 Tax=Chlorobaculum tepidum (strain ATCC 49652 / DSM 12025 / NBRC 103806 / TLS) TaxID=194439 RepID=Q8KBU8_CHLTE|nr:hypothetical protein CT1684 [Chlorobaculum tepidum TLS]HBU22537.1 hypothetical protein [Chlorobaculum sp.]